MGDGSLVDRLKLRSGPRFRPVAIEAHGGVQGLHGTVREVGEFVFGHEPIAGGDAIHRRLITTGDRNVAGRAGELFIRRPQLR